MYREARILQQWIEIIAIQWNGKLTRERTGGHYDEEKKASAN